MAKQTSTGELIKIEALSPALTSLEAPKKSRRLAKAGLIAGALAATLTAVTAKPNRATAQASLTDVSRASHPLDYVGVTSNRIWVPDLNQARAAAGDIAALNANTVRIFQPYNPGRAEISSDLSRLCNAAEAARENNLTLEISFIGFQEVINNDGKKQLKHNFVPSNAGGVLRYLNVVKSILLDVAGPNANQPGPNGEPACVEQPLDKLIIEDFDEVNSSSFNSNTDAAQGYAYLESRAIPVLAKIESDINNAFEDEDSHNQDGAPHFALVHAVGALAVSNHDPVGFLKDFDKALKGFGIKKPNFLLAMHPYPADPATNPAEIEANIFQPIRDELNSAWGMDQVPVFMDEIAVNAISPENRLLYGPRSLQAAAVSEGLQAQYYKDTIVEASLEDDVEGVLTFQSQDVKNDGWPSGIYNPNGQRKDSWNTVAKTFYEARAGTLDNN